LLQIFLNVQDGHVNGYNRASPDTEQQNPLFQHSLQNIARFSHVYNNHCTFMYLLRDNLEPLLYCYLYRAHNSDDVSKILVFILT
jgi:hypothetical protein